MSAPKKSMLNAFQEGVREIFSNSAKTSLDAISTMRSNTSGQATTSSEAATAALEKAEAIATLVEAKQKEILVLQNAAETLERQREEEAAAAETAKRDAEKVFAASKAAAEQKEATDAAERARKAADDDAANKAAIDGKIKEIDDAKKELLSLARQANVQASAAAEMANAASKEKMANYAGKNSGKLPVTTNATKNILSKLPVLLAKAAANGSSAVAAAAPKVNNGSGSASASAAANGSAAAASFNGGRRRKTRRRRAAKKRGTKRR